MMQTKGSVGSENGKTMPSSLMMKQGGIKSCNHLPFFLSKGRWMAYEYHRKRQKERKSVIVPITSLSSWLSSLVPPQG